MSPERSRILISIGLFLILISLLASGCSPPAAPELKVVTCTTLISQIVRRVGSGKIDVVNIIPPDKNPADFNIKQEDIRELTAADLFIYDTRLEDKFPPELIESAGNLGLNIARVELSGNWLIPSIQLEAVDKVTEILIQVDGKNSSVYENGAANYRKKIKDKQALIEFRLEDFQQVTGKVFKRTNVICAEASVEFVEWMGFNIFATYARPDSLTPNRVKELVDGGREAQVRYVMDNLQTGKHAGEGIAETLDILGVTLSNFPGGFNNTDTWEQTIDRNIGLVLGAESPH